MLLAGAMAAAIYYNRSTIGQAAQSGVEDVEAALTGWKAVGQGNVWVPVLNQAETTYGLPPDLLARIAYQESRFRPEVIDGSVPSSAGALGLMQLMPQYFRSVQGPRPFAYADTYAQIDEAAQLLKSLYSHFSDWTLAIAGYNDGQGNIDQYVAGNRELPAQTQTYVADVIGDVPVSGVLA